MDQPSGTTDAADAPLHVKRMQRGFVSSYGEGRTCADAGCDQRLSRYNNTDRCWSHATASSGRP